MRLFRFVFLFSRPWCRGVLQAPDSRGKCAFCGAFGAAQHRYPLEEKKGDMHPVFPLSLFSLYYISVCLYHSAKRPSAHNKQNLLSIFTYPNNGICADKLAGEPNIPHRRFESYRFCLCAICALKIFSYSAESVGTF